MSEKSFANFGRSFQEKCLQALMIDRNWAIQFVEVFNVDECLDQAYLKLIANKYIGHYRDFKEFPSLDLIQTILSDGLDSDKDLVLREQCNAFMKKVVFNQELGDLPWVKEKAFQFCRQQLLKKALMESADIIATDQYETVVGIMKAAITAGTATSVGYDYNNDIDARYSETYRNTIKTGIPELDDRKITNGGLGMGEIGIVCAPTGVGKCVFSPTAFITIQYEEVELNGKIYMSWEKINTKRGLIGVSELREDDELINL